MANTLRMIKQLKISRIEFNNEIREQGKRFWMQRDQTFWHEVHLKV